MEHRRREHRDANGERVNVGVVGLGYVGITAVGCLAELGHTVRGFEINTAKVQSLESGQFPIVEPGVGSLINSNSDRISYSERITADDVSALDVILVCVGTPTDDLGKTDMRAMDRAIEELGNLVDSDVPIVIRSTIPIGSTQNYKARHSQLRLYFHPEFLREGTAVQDFFKPPKIIFGIPSVEENEIDNLVRSLYPSIEAPNFYMTYESAESVKYADNIFHALKVAFVNEFSSACIKLGADATAVMDAFRADRQLNISEAYLRPGFAYGGSCLEKDLLSFQTQAKSDLPLFAAVSHSNTEIIQQFYGKIVSEADVFLINGLAFKEGIDDLRRSPFVSLALLLLDAGKTVFAYDSNLDNLFGESRSILISLTSRKNFFLNTEFTEGTSEAVVIMAHKSKHAQFPEALDSNYQLWFGGDLRAVYA